MCWCPGIGRADNVPEDVRADVREHPDPWTRWSGRGPVLCRARRAGGRRRDDLFPGSQRRRQDPHQIVAAGFRRRHLVLFRPPAALRSAIIRATRCARRKEGVLAAREAKLEEWLDLLTE